MGLMIINSYARGNRKRRNYDLDDNQQRKKTKEIKMALKLVTNNVLQFSALRILTSVVPVIPVQCASFAYLFAQLIHEPAPFRGALHDGVAASGRMTTVAGWRLVGIVSSSRSPLSVYRSASTGQDLVGSWDNPLWFASAGSGS